MKVIFRYFFKTKVIEIEFKYCLHLISFDRIVFLFPLSCVETKQVQYVTVKSNL